MRDLEVADEGLEVAGHELDAVVDDYSRAEAGMSFVSSLEDDLGIGLLHGGTNVPGENGAGAAIEDRAEGVGRAGDVEIEKVDVLVVIGFNWLNKAGAFLARFGVPWLEQAGVLSRE